MKWEVVIGLETHAQLSTASKIFSGASTAFGAAPNTQASAVDLALPGVLPVPNRGAVERAIRFGLAVGATINRRSIFARKNYFYPDLPKGYQISQYEIPVVQGGTLTIMTGKGEQATGKVIRLTRAHLEEDAGKSLHEDYHGMTGIDLNRAGTPLLEIVSEPDLRSAVEAIAYAKQLHELVQWHGICDGNMQEGSFRCDANVSVRPLGQIEYGTRCEIKNLNSFRFMEKAIEYEVRRQIALIEDGGRVVQETRLYDPDRDETRPMRSKEDAMDYRYFPDPDLPPLVVDDAWIELVRLAMPESQAAMKARFIRDFGLSAYDANLLSATRATGEFFEACVTAAGGEAKLVANWINGALAAVLNDLDAPIDRGPMTVGQLAALINRIRDGTISGKAAKEVFDELVSAWGQHGSGAVEGVTPTATLTAAAHIDQIIATRGLQQISDSGAIEKIVDDVLSANAALVADYKSGKEKAFNALVGQVMKASKGSANPAQANALLKRKLGS
ncbi:MAG: Asp-tRNA(Asn)/Glu-tRNA(Gln) amidotransferase subunit GatB [Betaproteobacteria bacterium]